MTNFLKLGLVLMAFSLFPMGQVQAAYNANMSGKIKYLLVYTDADYVYIQLENQPTSHPTCNPTFFVIHATTPAERIDRLYSRAMAAMAAGIPINLGYDSQGDCAHGYIRIHRVG